MIVMTKKMMTAKALAKPKSTVSDTNACLYTRVIRMSVAPALMDESMLIGPPPVSTKIVLKSLKLKAKPATSSGEVATNTNGKVIWEKT